MESGEHRSQSANRRQQSAGSKADSRAQSVEHSTTGVGILAWIYIWPLRFSKGMGRKPLDEISPFHFIKIDRDGNSLNGIFMTIVARNAGDGIFLKKIIVLKITGNVKIFLVEFCGHPHHITAYFLVWMVIRLKIQFGRAIFR